MTLDSVLPPQTPFIAKDFPNPTLRRARQTPDYRLNFLTRDGVVSQAPFRNSHWPNPRGPVHARQYFVTYPHFAQEQAGPPVIVNQFKAAFAQDSNQKMERAPK